MAIRSLKGFIFLPLLWLTGCEAFFAPQTTAWFHLSPSSLVSVTSEFKYESLRLSPDESLEDRKSELVWGLSGGLFPGHPCPNSTEITGFGFDSNRQTFWAEGKCKK